jgi:hypothetical protein
MMMAELNRDQIVELIRLIDEEITDLKRREHYLKDLRDRLWACDSNSLNISST